MSTWTGRNALTVDVEDYFHVAALAESISRDDWDSITPRVADNTERLLDLFAAREVQATFFVLGWVAERFPALVRRVVAAGHELACHGYSHQLIYLQDPREFHAETRQAKDCLEQAAGVAVQGYRAASYSITRRSLWAVETIAELGFRYDSSIVPARHDLYGIAGAPAAPYVLEFGDGARLREFPPSTIALAGIRLPVAGGGYFRIFPYWFSRWGMRRVNGENRPFSFYLHPWEIDPQQPRVKAGLKSSFRHYHNLAKFEPRLKSLLDEFDFAPMGKVLEEYPAATVRFAALERLAGQPA